MIFVDGASNEEGCGAGLLLIDPEGSEFTYALRFDFKATNNEAEYEAVIAGLELAKKMKASKVQVCSDSQIVVNQINGDYEVREPQLMKYLERITSLRSSFERFSIRNIPRSQNKRADALSKLASSSFSHLSKKVLVEILPQRSTEVQQVSVVEEVGDTWMTPIQNYLESGQLPTDKDEARRLQLRASHYILQDGILYRKAYLQPLQRCIGPTQAEYVIREMHHGSCGSHTGSRALMKKIMRWGYYWPALANDVFEFIQKCEQCQRYAPITRQPQSV